jgi:hypothetical protein
MTPYRTDPIASLDHLFTYRRLSSEETSGPRRSSLPIGVTSMMPTFSRTFRTSASGLP